MWFRFCVGVGKVVDDPVSKVEPTFCCKHWTWIQTIAAVENWWSELWTWHCLWFLHTKALFSTMFWGAQCVLSLAQYWHIVPLFGHSLMLLVQAASFPLLLKQSDQKSKSSFKKVQSNIKSKLETLFGWSRSMIHERSQSGWVWVVSTGRATESRIYGSLTKKIVVEMLQIYKLLLRWHRKDLSIGQWRGTNIAFF